MGDTYVSSKQLVLSQKELDELSITDCSEIWRLYAWYKTKVIPAKDDAEKEEVRKRIGVIAKSLDMLEKYKTVYEGGEGEIVEKKSRFIATVAGT